MTEPAVTAAPAPLRIGNASGFYGDRFTEIGRAHV